jgi:hypothetical protein
MDMLIFPDKDGNTQSAILKDLPVSGPAVQGRLPPAHPCRMPPACHVVIQQQQAAPRERQMSTSML